MADLSVLIRLHKHELDEKRLALAQLYAAQQELAREQRDLDLAFEREKAAVDVTGDIHFTFARYAETVKEKRTELAAREIALQQQIDAAKDSMMQTFSDLKKYEMTQAERERLEREEQQVRESKAMDDIGLETFRRKEGE